MTYKQAETKLAHISMWRLTRFITIIAFNTDLTIKWLQKIAFNLY